MADHLESDLAGGKETQRADHTCGQQKHDQNDEALQGGHPEHFS